MAPFGSGFRVSGVHPADDWRIAPSKRIQDTMNPQNPLHSRFVPLAPLAPPAQRGRFVPLEPRVTKVIPPAPEASGKTLDPRIQILMKRLIPFEAVLLQWVAVSPSHGRIFFEDPLQALSKAQVALPASLLSEVRGASASFRDHSLVLIAACIDCLNANSPKSELMPL
jgi:hypothetical protein